MSTDNSKEPRGRAGKAHAHTTVFFKQKIRSSSLALSSRILLKEGIQIHFTYRETETWSEPEAHLSLGVAEALFIRTETSYHFSIACAAALGARLGPGPTDCMCVTVEWIALPVY